MKTVELYARVRHAVQIEGISRRAAAERFGINARTVSKMLKFSVPPGYVRRKAPFRPKLEEFIGIIDAILIKRFKSLISFVISVRACSFDFIFTRARIAASWRSKLTSNLRPPTTPACNLGRVR